MHMSIEAMRASVQAASETDGGSLPCSENFVLTIHADLWQTLCPFFGAARIWLRTSLDLLSCSHAQLRTIDVRCRIRERFVRTLPEGAMRILRQRQVIEKVGYSGMQMAPRESRALSAADQARTEFSWMDRRGNRRMDQSAHCRARCQATFAIARARREGDVAAIV